VRLITNKWFVFKYIKLY